MHVVIGCNVDVAYPLGGILEGNNSSTFLGRIGPNNVPSGD